MLFREPHEGNKPAPALGCARLLNHSRREGGQRCYGEVCPAGTSCPICPATDGLSRLSRSAGGAREGGGSERGKDGEGGGRNGGGRGS